MLVLARVFPTLRSKKGFLVIWKRGEYPLARRVEAVYLLESYSLDYLLSRNPDQLGQVPKDY